jgi:hypothetical protein
VVNAAARRPRLCAIGGSGAGCGAGIVATGGNIGSQREVFMSIDARRDRMDQFFEALRVLRIPWVVALVTFATLVLPDQVRDLYRALAENLHRPDGAIGDLSQPIATALLLVVAAFVTYRVGCHRAAVHHGRTANPGAVLTSSLRWGPPVCGTLLFAGTAFGMFLAIRDVSGIAGIASELDPIILEMKAAAWHLTIAGAAVAGGGLLFLLATYGWSRWRGPALFVSRPHLGKPWQVFFYAVAIFMVATAFFPALSVLYSQQVGSIAILFLFVSVLLVGLSLLQGASDRHGIPYVLLLIVWALIWNVLDGGNMHRVVLVERSKASPEDPSVAVRFREWLAARKDRDAFEGKPYPVYLVSSEAGGLYAAQFTAKVLARIQDQCPSFAQHIFAISGVSGGSLGAAMFAGLAKQEASNAAWKPCKLDFDPQPKPGPMEAKIDRLLDRDFLAPLVSRTLFADFMQHFVPASLASDLPGLRALTQLGRGRAFEESIEDAWARSVGPGSNPFSRSFLEHWDPVDAGPALLINTTNVEDGRLIVISPFWLNGGEVESDIAYLHSSSIPPDKDITLGTAVGLSGRFPWILPPARLPNTPLALVDGAYFEASGLETMRTVRFALRAFERGAQPQIKVHMIVIGSMQPEAVSTPGLLDEATPPVRTMLNVRLRRGYSVRNAFLEENRRREERNCPRTGLQSIGLPGTPASPDQPPPPSAVPCSAKPEPQFTLQYERFNLPLGWKLSRVMQNIVEQHSRGRCVPKDPEVLAKEVDPYSVQEIFWQNKRSEYLVAASLTPDPAQLIEEFVTKCN